MKATAWLALTAMVAVLLAGLLIAAPRSSAAESVTLDPSQGPAGTVVSVAGMGWAPGWSVHVQWDDGSILLTVVVDSSGRFGGTFVVPTGAMAGAHQVRFLAFVPPFSASCVGTRVVTVFTVGAAVTSTATATTTETSTATATATATETATSTGTVTATATVTETVTSTATTTTTATSTATGTVGMTPTVCVTPTSTATASVTNTPTRTPTRTPTKVTFPGSGSGGLLEQESDESSRAASLIVGAGVLAAAVGVTGFMVMRRRPR